MVPQFTNFTFLLAGYMTSTALSEIASKTGEVLIHGVANETGGSVLDETSSTPLTIEDVNALETNGEPWLGYAFVSVDNEEDEDGRKAVVVEMRIQLDIAEIEIPFTVKEDGSFDRIFPAQLVVFPEGTSQETVDMLLGEFNQGITQNVAGSELWNSHNMDFVEVTTIPAVTVAETDDAEIIEIRTVEEMEKASSEESAKVSEADEDKRPTEEKDLQE